MASSIRSSPWEVQPPSVFPRGVAFCKQPILAEGALPWHAPQRLRQF
jgi:hypothetical protein